MTAQRGKTQKGKADTWQVPKPDTILFPQLRCMGLGLASESRSTGWGRKAFPHCSLVISPAAQRAGVCLWSWRKHLLASPWPAPPSWHSPMSQQEDSYPPEPVGLSRSEDESGKQSHVGGTPGAQTPDVQTHTVTCVYILVNTDTGTQPGPAVHPLPTPHTAARTHL